MTTIRTNVYSIIYTEDENGATYRLRMAHPKVPDLVISQPPGRADNILAVDLLAASSSAVKKSIEQNAVAMVDAAVHNYYKDKLSELADIVSRGYVKDAPAIVERIVNILKGAKS